jgi:DNA processing protein
LNISNDSYAVLLLCSDLAMRNAGIEAKAYTVKQWSNLSRNLSRNGLVPSALFDVSSMEIRTKLSLPDAEVNRIETLLKRAGQFGIELASLNEKGIFTLTASDDDYPAALRTKLGELAPPVLYYAGSLSLLNNKGIAIVGSRDIDEDAFKFADLLSKRCISDGLNIVSGGARGVDSIAENAANNMEGSTVIVVADSLEKKIRQKETREAVMRKQAIILSAARPDMPFQTYTAMERNKYVYALSDYVVVVSSSYNEGGTWAGATENLRHGWVPLFVRKAENMPEGNSKLLDKESVFPITAEILNDKSANIFEWFTSYSKETEKSNAGKGKEEYHQQTLFDMFR